MPHFPQENSYGKKFNDGTFVFISVSLSEEYYKRIKEIKRILTHDEKWELANI
jgi:hypothetical protein